MDFSSLHEIAGLLSRVNWDLAVGILLVPVFLGLGVFYLVQGHWPWDEKYKAVALGGTFLFLAASLGSGLSGVGGAFWSVGFVALLIYAIYTARNIGLWWLNQTPVRDQTYDFKGVGKVTVEQTTSPESPFGVVVLGLPDGGTSEVSMVVFAVRATLVPAPESEPCGVEEREPPEELLRRNQPASSWRKQGS